MKHARQHEHVLEFRWPVPPFQVALVEPEIPPNTGNIARLCAATGSPLHLVEPLGFRLTDHAVQRAGLDYWDSVRIVRHMNFAAFRAGVAPARLFFFSTRARRSYLEAAYQPGDVLVFGSEHRGLADDILDAHPEQVFGIPMQADKVRSLNLANSVSIVLYEALRQAAGGNRYPSPPPPGPEPAASASCG
jgi:tRNA (cytidine/uridine-2'-O-)-methyltransferase